MHKLQSINRSAVDMEVAFLPNKPAVEVFSQSKYRPIDNHHLSMKRGHVDFIDVIKFFCRRKYPVIPWMI
jgi:hypothetical protein